LSANSPVERYLAAPVREDLREKMVFVGGPRQVGKTTLALGLLGASDESHPGYLSWDDASHRRLLLAGGLPAEQPLIVLDEIHKYRRWRNLVKGFYDRHKSHKQFLITGSARLDHYRRGGDSLQGRYHYYRLHPFSLHELNRKASASDLAAMLQFGGFPEPFLRQNTRHWKRWQRERKSRVIQDDLINLEHVRELSQLELLADLLPDRVGSLLSIANLRQDLSVAFETADKWVGILENLYYCFRITPYGLPRLRAVRKLRKLYLWDWSLCRDESARFENLVASHLLKHCHLVEDTQGDEMSLRFLRDTAGREIDFVVLKNGKPELAVECKAGGGLSRNIVYFAQRTPIARFYQVHLERNGEDSEWLDGKARILPFVKFCDVLGL
jgi:predicted AAA+ superfamily ATPase